MGAPMKPQFTGARVTRLEDARLLSGQGHYLDDIAVQGMLEMVFVRSNRAAAKISSIDLSQAQKLSGVHAVLTAKDCPVNLYTKSYDVGQPVLADGEVRYVGEPVVAVIAENRYVAEDAADLVHIEYQPLAPVIDSRKALNEEPRRVFSHRPNTFFHKEHETDGFQEAFRSAPNHLSQTLTTNRQTGVAMETRACAAMTDPLSGRLTFYCSHQSPHELRTQLTQLLGLAENQVRVVVPEVGGAFGIKAMLYPEYFVTAIASQKLKRPVKWISDRTEGMQSDAHARDNIHEVQVAYENDGRIIAIVDRVIGNTGAYPFRGFPGAVGEAGWATDMLTGPYKVPHVSITIDCVFSNKTPVGAYRGVGGPVGAWVHEAVVDAVARRLKMDPADVRRVNLIQQEDFPYETPTGELYDPGSYSESMEAALKLVNYEEFRKNQAELRNQGRYLGIGMCVFVEPTAGVSSEAGSTPYESASIRMEPNGTVTAALGLGPSGQGHETTMAQIIADQIGVDVKDVVVLHGDTDSAPFGGGTGGSRSGAIGGGAAIRAGQEMRKRLVKLAAHLLEAAEEDVELEAGQAQVAGVPSRGIPIRDLARTAYNDVSRLPDDMPIGLEVVARYRPQRSATYSNGTHVAVVEVDIRTGLVTVLDYAAVNDCGTLINPTIVEGQIHGGVAQGIGSAFLEELRYDADGQLTNTSLMDYLLPVSTEVPRMKIEHIQTPSDGEGGFKGMGEGSLIAAPAALANAVSDALAPFQVEVTEIPVTPAQVVQWTSRT
ncbi:xanthine dehydrogenase family protein molybdopterin-binding subunit [Alicyclobacillus sp. SO9]|uniref:xanthine dehydrogenase family protein molybdopterin-binding subunit n=1 Tax=Alicyclobacillus sp. SO9 TaxID=2665646 RepID=UPI0018E7EA36|nr:xanthine dehydrogenase family protein molybdopterin-binding subunit [Alicyclobacillus sp. SO9]QQE77742.1 xanthine dehydrogenase family protein [Alicyclobacillus sp. SO9]